MDGKEVLVEREAIEGDWSEQAVSRESEMVSVIGRPELRRRFSFFDSGSGGVSKEDTCCIRGTHVHHVYL
ncbi:unnamed protein product [Brassica rapa]|uniref:Uncharacterized protein n=1 Tax=Brassica campestris TaxID=3711 RepID=A0A8D9GAX4_BRACM|nr:unnamed protein product [Brassica rapa]